MDINKLFSNKKLLESKYDFFLKKGLNPETIDEVIESFEEEIKNYDGVFESGKEVGKLLNLWKNTIKEHDNGKHDVFVRIWGKIR